MLPCGFTEGRTSELQPVVLHASTRQAVHLVYRRFETGHYPVAAHRHFRIVVCQPTDLVTDYNEKRMSTHGDDLIAFGKYRGHFLYEILRIDPGYVNWIAFKYTPIIPKQERFVKMAQAYNCVYLDKMLKKKYQPRPTSRFLGKKGDKLSNLTLKITKVRVEDDPYRTRVIGTTPVFFVRQRLTAIDASGNLVNLTFASGNPSHASGQLPSLEHAYRPGEVLHISSARIAATVESYGIQYTRLNYVKIGK